MFASTKSREEGGDVGYVFIMFVRHATFLKLNRQ